MMSEARGIPDRFTGPYYSNIVGGECFTMTISDIEIYSSRRLRFTVAWLAAVILILILVALLSHPRISDNRPVWKLSPYGEPQESGTAKAATDSTSRPR